MALGLKAWISARLIEQLRSSEYAQISRSRRQIKCEYWEPKSKTRIPIREIVTLERFQNLADNNSWSMCARNALAEAIAVAHASTLTGGGCTLA